MDMKKEKEINRKKKETMTEKGKRERERERKRKERYAITKLDIVDFLSQRSESVSGEERLTNLTWQKRDN